MDIKQKTYRRDCLLGALGALLMLVGDLCLSVIPAHSGDSGLFAREHILTVRGASGVCRFSSSQGFAAWRSDFSRFARH